MPKYLPTVTHCLMRTPLNKEDMDAMNGTVAIIALCFGSDVDLLCPIRIKKIEGPIKRVDAEMPKAPIIRDGQKSWGPLLTGKLAEEARDLALAAFDKVAKKLGIKFGKLYRVFDNKVEEVIASEA